MPTFPALVTPKASRRVDRVSRLLVSWRSDDLSVRALSGQLGVFGRNSSGGAYLGTDGRVRAPASLAMPGFHCFDDDGDFVYERPSFVIEPTRTNGFTFSEDLTNAAWTKAGASITADAIIAPNGVKLADKLAEFTDFGSAHYIERATVTLADNTASTFSFFARAAERTWIAIGTFNKASVALLSFVDLANGVLGTTVGGHLVSIERYRPSTTPAEVWWRVKVTFSSASGGGAPRVQIYAAQANNQNIYDGIAGNGVYIWGLQLEAGAAATSGWYPTSYIPAVSSSAVVRSPDTYTIPFGFLPPVVGDELTIYAEFEVPWGRSNTFGSDGLEPNPGVFVVGGTTGFAADAKMAIDVFRDQTNANLRCRLNVNETGDAEVSPQLVVPSSGHIRLLLQVQASASDHLLAASLNGGAVSTSATRRLYTATSGWRTSTVDFGKRGNPAFAADVGTVYMIAFKIAKGRFTESQMQQLL